MQLSIECWTNGRGAIHPPPEGGGLPPLRAPSKIKSSSRSFPNTAKIDQNESNLVWYKLEIQNLANSTRAARIIDWVPEGMVFLNASLDPSSHENGTVVWDLIEVGPFETFEIVYRLKALRSGRFANEAKLDIRSIDGPTTEQIHAISLVEIDEFEGENIGPGWRPPDWGLDSDVCCEEVTSGYLR